MEHTIDAKSKRLGRIASLAAVKLMGKDKPTFAKNKVENIKVKVINASAIDVYPREKKDQKLYTRFSGYPGGLKQETFTSLSKRRGYSEVVRKAVYGMLPGNKLRDKRMKNLIITE